MKDMARKKEADRTATNSTEPGGLTKENMDQSATVAGAQGPVRDIAFRPKNKSEKAHGLTEENANQWPTPTEAYGSAEHKGPHRTATSKKGKSSAKEQVDPMITSSESHALVKVEESEQPAISTHRTATSKKAKGSVRKKVDPIITSSESQALVKGEGSEQPAISTEANSSAERTPYPVITWSESYALAKGKESEQTAISTEANSSAEGTPDPVITQTEPRKLVKENVPPQTSAPTEVQSSAKESEKGRTARPKRPAPPKICSKCFQDATVKCIRCGSSWYCSRNCQRKDWTYHKHLCQEFKKFQDRPDPTFVRAIFFPVREESPRFVWIKQKEEYLDLYHVNEKFHVEELLGVSDEEKVAQQYVTRSIRRTWGMQEITARAWLLFRKDCFVDGSRPNKSVAAVTNGQFEYSWRGPMVAVMTQFDDSEDKEDEAEADDMTMVDFRDLIDFFGMFGTWHANLEDFAMSSFWWLPLPLKEQLEQRRQVRCVKVACDTEYRHTGVSYESWLIGEGHPAMDLLQPLPITALLGLPLVMRRFPNDQAYKEEARMTGNTNRGPSLLLLDVNPKNKDWSLWRTGPEASPVKGNVILMRQDGRDLEAQHVEAMIMYIRLLVPAMEESERGERERGQVLDMLHPSRWDWFFRKLKRERGETDISWRNVPPLFEAL
ncbi:MAG: hypothetical protein L6R40_000927 [Gallowayella cf. fulva]|nr:MAG: hypothetical protein L6R40_000927 [Xanthomendoza cf. fulva]